MAELEEAGYLSHTLDGRRNRSTIHPALPFRHPLERALQARALLDALARTVRSTEGKGPSPRRAPGG